MKKISLFLPHIGDGGLTRVMLTLLEGFIAKGYFVDLVVTRSAKVDEMSHLIPEGAAIIKLKSKRTATSIFPLAEYLKKNNPMILLSGGSGVNCIAIAAKLFSKSNTKLIITEHSLPSVDLYDSEKIIHKIIPFLVSRLYTKADFIVAVSNAVALDLSSFAKIPIEKIKVIYNPVVTKELLQKKDMECDHPWFTDEECPVVLFVGRLVNVKNIPLIINSFSKVLKRINCKLLIVGDGPEKENLKALVKNFNLSESIDFVGYARNPYPYMKCSDVLILASKWEGLPTVLIEAMSCGAQVIATDNLAGAKEILEDGKYGFLAASNEEAISSSIIESFTVKNQIKLIEKANEFTLERSINQYIDLIES